MKQVSDENMGRLVVIATVPMGLMVIAIFGSLLAALLFDWNYGVDVAMMSFCGLFVWGAVSFCVSMVLEYWPQRD